MYNLRSKPCHIGSSINTRTQRHGEEPVPYLDVPITLSINAKELNAIMGNGDLADSWFESKDGKLVDPLLKGWAPYKFRGKFENSIAKMTVGINAESIDLGNCTLNKLEFEPQSDGRVALSLKIQAAADVKRAMLILWLDRDVDVLLQFGQMVGDEAQEELDLKVDDDDAPATSEAALEQDEADQQSAQIAQVVNGKPRRGRKSQPQSELN